jgi:hypothetical protein
MASLLRRQRDIRQGSIVLAHVSIVQFSSEREAKVHAKMNGIR